MHVVDIVREFIETLDGERPSGRDENYLISRHLGNRKTQQPERRHSSKDLY